MRLESTDISRMSVEPSVLRHLSDSQKERLAAILERYMESLENGTPLSPESLVDQHPDLAETLVTYFASLNDLHGMAAGFHGDTPPHHEPEAEAEGECRRIGDFRLIREIGRGGMGVVYEAEQISLGRRIALKILPFAAVLDSKQIARFKNEAQAAAQVHHPHIVPVFAIGADRGVHYYAMQFIDGFSLDRVIAELREKRRAPDETRSRLPSGTGVTAEHAAVAPAAVDTVMEDLCPQAALTGKSFHTVRRCADVQVVVRLGIQAAEALHAAHEYGVVHRDIKPSNLLLDVDGKLWVADFGLARLPSDLSLTQTGDVVGTVRYMSPEQAAGKSALVDHRSDIYSLGITLYELLALQPAFPERDGHVLPTPEQREAPRSLRKLRPDVPVDLETVILRAIAADRESRYESAEALASDLRRVLEGVPTLARPPSIAERLTRFARRHRRMAAGMSTISMLAVLGLIVATFVVTREKKRAEQNYQRAERNFRDARQAVDRFGAQLAERLADVPGAASVRQELLRETLRYYQEFVDQAQGDPSLRADLAVTYSKVGSLAGELSSRKDEIGAHATAVRLFEELVREAPQDTSHRQRLGQCRNNLGLALRRAGKLESAREVLLQAVHVQEQLVQDFPRDDQYVADLALSYSNLGLLWNDLHRTGDAENALKAAVRWHEMLVRAHPSHSEHRRRLAATFNNLAALYVQKQPAEAGRYYQHALEHQGKLVGSAPADLKCRSELALTHNNLGALHSRLRNLAKAAASYQESIRIQQEIVRLAPLQKSHRHDLAVASNNLGLIQSRIGDRQSAEKSYQLALDLHAGLVAQYPEDAALQSSFGGVYNNLGSMLEDSKEFARAAEAFRQAVEHQRLAFTRGGQNDRYRTYLSKHYFNYGRILRQLGRGEQAASVALERRLLWPDSPDRLYSVAEELALACQSFSDTPTEKITREQCAGYAIETLQLAIHAGYEMPGDIAGNMTFASIRDDARFTKLVNR